MVLRLSSSPWKMPDSPTRGSLPVRARYIRSMRAPSAVLFAFATLLPVAAQDVKPKDVREVAKGGSNAIPQLEQYLKNQPPDVRAEAVKQLTEVGTSASLDQIGR